MLKFIEGKRPVDQEEDVHVHFRSVVNVLRGVLQWQFLTRNGNWLMVCEVTEEGTLRRGTGALNVPGLAVTNEGRIRLAENASIP